MCKGQDLQAAVEDYHTEEILFFTDIWHNPTMRFSYPLQQTTDVSLTMGNTKNDAQAVQLGSKSNQFRFRANSFFRDKEKQYLYYGKATYSKGKEKDFRWNTLTDVALLQPYIVADTIGGEMDKEQYFFSGGYAKKLGKITLGGFGSYRAETAYKTLDPRPNNTVSDMNITLGSSIAITTNYQLGWDISYNRYQQNQNLGIYKDGGGAAIFFLRGFGVADEYFTGKITDKSSVANKYKIDSYRTGLSLYPQRNKGWFAAVSYQLFDFRLLSVDKQYNDVSTFDSYSGKLQIGYKFQVKDRNWAAKGIGLYQQKDGTEYSYNFNNELLNTAPKYKEEKQVAEVEAMGEVVKTEKLKSYFLLGINYERKDISYMGIGRKAVNSEEYSNVTSSVAKIFQWSFPKSFFLVKLNAAYRFNVDEKLQAGTLVAKTAMETLVVPDHKFYTADCLRGSLLLRYDYSLKNAYRIYAKGEFNYTNYSSIGKNTALFFSLGLAF